MKQTVLALTLWIVLLGLLAGCVGNEGVADEATPLPAVVAEATNTPEPTTVPEPTPVPERALVICLGKEPETLFLYGGASESMWSVLEAIYDGPFDVVDYEVQPVILQSLPAVDNGGVVFEPVAVSEGDIVVDAAGVLQPLMEGINVFPAGCTNPGCAVSWQADQGIEMDRMIVQYQLLEGVLWSDGAALTAYDSEFSFRVAQDPAMPVSSYLIDRTAAYQAVSATEIAWTGIAGFFPRNIEDLFWIPLPKHQLEMIPAAELLTMAETNQYPLGWGPYVIEDWAAGDHITLKRNENYFRAAQTLPAFDRLVYRFSGDTPMDFLQSLQIGECDVVGRSADLGDIVHDVRVAELDGEVNLYLNQGPEWTQLLVGIQPASYDDGYSFYQGDRPDFFSDPQMRQAISVCLNREEIVSRYYFNMVTIPDSFVLPTHPLYAPDNVRLGYDPELGKALLDELGWKDFGGAARVASGVAGVVDGTVLEIDLALLESATSLRNSNILERYADDLSACGFQTSPVLASPIDLYAPGPEGRVFGRNFDLAEITWAAGREPACVLYMSDQVPDSDNYWVGVNAGGYQNSEYDAACLTARNTRLDDFETYQTAHYAAQQIFMTDLPAIPLYFQLEAAASRIDLCNFMPTVSARSDFWNLETFDIAENCIEPIE